MARLYAAVSRMLMGLTWTMSQEPAKSEEQANPATPARVIHYRAARAEWRGEEREPDRIGIWRALLLVLVAGLVLGGIVFISAWLLLHPFVSR